MKIILGPAGSPEKSTIEGLKFLHNIGLGAMEVAFTHGVRMSNDLAIKINEENKKYGISLSIHAPYYINLASDDEKKVEDSKKRILDSCERGHFMGSKKIVFHAAYYGKNDEKDVYKIVEKEIKSIIKKIKENQWDIEILPETMGKLAQFGTLDEIIKLSKNTGCGICIDPAHIFARNNGNIDFHEMFNKLEELNGNNHFHFSGINYGPRGERNHLVLGEGGPDFNEFAKELIEREISATIISESPITWKDSITMKKILENMGYKF